MTTQDQKPDDLAGTDIIERLRAFDSDEHPLAHEAADELLASRQRSASAVEALREIDAIEGPMMADDDYQEGCVDGFHEALGIVQAISSRALTHSTEQD